jgi:hypothetical protein
MTYMYKGKQYIVVAVGSTEHPTESSRWLCPSAIGSI